MVRPYQDGDRGMGERGRRRLDCRPAIRSLPGLSKRRRPARILRDRMGKDPAVAP